jgi:hypothetical protein
VKRDLRGSSDEASTRWQGIDLFLYKRELDYLEVKEFLSVELDDG